MLTAILISIAVLLAPEPAPVVPVGSILTKVEGIMVRPQPTDPWHFRITGEAADPQGRHRDFVLMPNRVLEDMERSQAGSIQQVTFTLSGNVTLFEGRNWIMPRHAEVHTGHAPREEPTQAPVDPGEEMREGTSDGDSIADIVADLQSSIKTLPRTLDAGTADAADTTEEPDGTLILSRRGRLLRGRHGAWVFVFDADAWGGSDAPAVLLPSSTLLTLVQQGRRGDYRNPVHLSGSMTTYRGRRFLLPTAVTELRERANLSR